MRRAALGSAVGALCLCSPVFGQTTPPPDRPSSRQRPPTEALDPGSGISAVYGTSNLSKGVTAVVATTPDTKVQVLLVRPSTLLAAQNRRRQPPPKLTDYTIYTHNDDLIRTLEKLKRLPKVDLSVPVVLAWNHVALDMTSIDHTTVGTKVKVASAPKGELPVFESTYGEQFGPPRASRAMAIVHLAMFEALNTVDPRYASYKPPGQSTDLHQAILQRLGAGTPINTQTASVSAAVTEAAYQALIKLYPRKTALIEASKAQISLLISAQEKARSEVEAQDRIAIGTRVGAAAALVVSDERSGDGADVTDSSARCGRLYEADQPQDTFIPDPLCREAYFPMLVEPPQGGPFFWTIDPVVPNPLELGKNWGMVHPFVADVTSMVTDAGLELGNGNQIPRPKPDQKRVQDALDKGAYGALISDPHSKGKKIRSQYGVRLFGAFNPSGSVVVPSDGGARSPTPGSRNGVQTRNAQFWGYDATALLCAPPRLYNMVATSIFLDHLNPKVYDPHAAVRAARYLALVNVALADAGIAAWAGKYKYDEARPVTYLRDHVPPGSPVDGTWTPLGQVASNGLAPNTTPPFPAYPSGHAVFGAAAFEIIAKVLDLDPAGGSSSFDFVSDEYNGFTLSFDGQPRPFYRAHYVSLDAAKWENAESRVWLGVHWQQDADDGVALGNAIADRIYAQALKPLAGH